MPIAGAQEYSLLTMPILVELKQAQELNYFLCEEYPYPVWVICGTFEGVPRREEALRNAAYDVFDWFLLHPDFRDIQTGSRIAPSCESVLLVLAGLPPEYGGLLFCVYLTRRATDGRHFIIMPQIK